MDERKQKMLADHLRRKLAGSVPRELLSRIDDRTLIARWHEHHAAKIAAVQERAGRRRNGSIRILP